MRKVLLAFAAALITITVSAQVSINTNRNPPDPSAMLDIQSNQKGLLIPRMTAVQRTGITAPANGLLVFDTDSSTLYIYTGSWKKILFTEFFTYYYRDKDGDGYGDKFQPVGGFAPLEGFVSNNQDCDDNDASVTPNKVWYPDADGDGYGVPGTPTTSCTKPPGFAATSNDCNDGNANIFPTANDPAGDLIDGDCDAMDGKESQGIFVSNTGNDGNIGTKTSPVASITEGLTRAVASGKPQLYIATGTYNERVTLVNGISLFGSYHATSWARSATSNTNITGTELGGRVIGIQGTSITTTTIIDRVTISTANATFAGASNYAIHCVGCPAVELKNSLVRAGRGGNGLTGGSGSPGAWASGGGNGGQGACDAEVNAFGGGAGNSPCGRNGGNGGAGGFGNNNGAPGGGGTLGGGGGAWGDPGRIGFSGISGAFGAAGSNGGGGNGGSVSSNYWSGISGSSGAPGSPGNGGGGGGGGGGQDQFLGIGNGTGNGGGGGGGGGCPGSNGIGGTAGGGSFAIFLLNGTGFKIENNSIQTAGGGTGGNGGTGGDGGIGGNGGAGAGACTSQVGAGGNGGRGGDGGRGGHGGGGAGGPSYGIYQVSTAATLLGNTYSISAGGPGGFSPGQSGTIGATGQTN